MVKSPSSEKVAFDNFCQCSHYFEEEWIFRDPSPTILEVDPPSSGFLLWRAGQIENGTQVKHFQAYILLKMNLSCLLSTPYFQKSHPGCIYSSGSSCFTILSFLWVYSINGLTAYYEAPSLTSLAFEDDGALWGGKTSSFWRSPYKSMVSRLTWGLRVTGNPSLLVPTPCLLSCYSWPLMLFYSALCSESQKNRL